MNSYPGMRRWALVKQMLKSGRQWGKKEGFLGFFAIFLLWRLLRRKTQRGVSDHMCVSEGYKAVWREKRKDKVKAFAVKIKAAVQAQSEDKSYVYWWGPAFWQLESTEFPPETTQERKTWSHLYNSSAFP